MDICNENKKNFIESKLSIFTLSIHSQIDLDTDSIYENNTNSIEKL